MSAASPKKVPTPAEQSVKASSRGSLSKILAGGVLVIVLAVIFLRGDQLVELADTVRKGAPVFLVLAVVSQLAKYFSQGWAYIYCFHAVSEDFRFRESIKLVFGTFFMNTVAPSLNLAGMTLVVDDAAKRAVINSFDQVLSLDLLKKAGELRAQTAAPAEGAEEIEALIAQRSEAKKVKDWGRADAIREQLKAMGVELKDTPNGVEWKRV